MSNTNPDYYKTGGIEPIDFIRAQRLNFNLGNVVKYVCRAGRKTDDPTGDLEKAMYYLRHEIETVKEENLEMLVPQGDRMSEERGWA